MITSRHAQTMASLALPVALTVERLEGTLHGSGEPVALACAGDAATASFMAGALFDVQRRERIGKLATPVGLRSKGFRRLCTDSDLVAMEVPRIWEACLPAQTQLRMPAWISQQIRAADGKSIVVPARVRKEARRHLRRACYEPRFSTDAGELRRFHAALYRPYVTARFGAAALVADEERFLAASRGMTLALLTAAEEWVAGMLLARRGDTLRFGWFGARSVPPPAGASEVLDATVLEWAAAQGVRRVVMGHSRPSLADGVVRYKSRFGAAIQATRFPQRVLGLWVRRWSPALAASLDAARFVTFRNGRPVVYRSPPAAPPA